MQKNELSFIKQNFPIIHSIFNGALYKLYGFHGVYDRLRFVIKPNYVFKLYRVIKIYCFPLQSYLYLLKTYHFSILHLSLMTKKYHSKQVNSFLPVVVLRDITSSLLSYHVCFPCHETRKAKKKLRPSLPLWNPFP